MCVYVRDCVSGRDRADVCVHACMGACVRVRVRVRVCVCACICGVLLVWRVWCRGGPAKRNRYRELLRAWVSCPLRRATVVDSTWLCDYGL